MSLSQHKRLERACDELTPPFACVDLDAFDANAADLVRRAAGTPLRLASKSVRCRALQRRGRDGPPRLPATPAPPPPGAPSRPGHRVADLLLGHPPARPPSPARPPP